MRSVRSMSMSVSSPSSRSTAGVWARRLPAVAIVAACVIGQLATLAHRVLVQHAVCVEHGESVHLRARAPALVASAGQRPPSSSPLRSLDDAASVAVEDHEHCALAASRIVPAPHLAAQTLAPPVDDTRWLAPPTRPPGPPSPPYLVAPKTSPPV